MFFEKPAYIVLDVSDPGANIVRNLRRRYDESRAELPVEVTIAGSSGVGVIADGQDADKVFSFVDSVASRFQPFEAFFGKINRFPTTGIFYFELFPIEIFNEIHWAVANSGIKFVESAFPFTPHCTLKLADKISSDKEMKSLLAFKPPKDLNFVRIESMSVYNYDGFDSNLLHRAKLGCEKEK